MKYTGKVTEASKNYYYVCLEGYTWCQRFKNMDNVKVGEIVEIEIKIVNKRLNYV